MHTILLSITAVTNNYIKVQTTVAGIIVTETPAWLIVFLLYSC